MSKFDRLLHGLHMRYYRSRYRRDEFKKIADDRRRRIVEQAPLSSEQGREIDAFYSKWYGKRIRHDWHSLYTAFTGVFDVRYVPDYIFLPEIELAFVDYRYERMVSDKNFLAILVQDIPGTSTPRALVTRTAGFFRDANSRLISRKEALAKIYDAGEVFVKPTTNTSSGKNCFVLHFAGGQDIKQGLTTETLVDKMGLDFAVQEKIVNHATLSALHSASVNTFRVTTYIWEDEIHHFPLLLRIGRGGLHLDNAHQGGMFIGVDDRGFLSKTAFTEFREAFDTHPFSGFVFEGHHIVQVPDLLRAAKAAHERIPQIGMVSWDLTVNADGLIIFVEANIKAQTIWMSQMANGKGAFGRNTEGVLSRVGKSQHRNAGHSLSY